MAQNKYTSLFVNGKLLTKDLLSNMEAAEFACSSTIMTDLYNFLMEWYNDKDYVIVQTSGSTGEPKRMKANKQQMINSASITCRHLGLKQGDSALLCMPIKYIAGKMMVVRAIVWGLNLIAVEPSVHPLKNCNEKIDFAAMTPMQVIYSLNVPQEKRTLAKISNLIIGGGAIDAELEEDIKQLPGKIYSTYGMTETLSHIALRRLNGAGSDEFYTPFPSVALSLSKEGTLIIDAPLVCNNQLVTNDIAELLPNGKFKIVGRKDNTINSGGIKVQPEKIEAMLRPIINASFAITSIPDKILGEAVALVIEKRDKYSILSLPEIEKICNKILDRYERPKRIIYVSELPLTETGKINRAALILMAKCSIFAVREGYIDIKMQRPSKC